MSNLKTQHGLNRPIKIQIISRNFPINYASGSNMYVLDFIRYLQKAGCEVGFVSLDPFPGQKFPWSFIPNALATTDKIWIRNNLRIARVLLRFNSLSDWLTVPLRLVYLYLPKQQKNIYRAVRDAFKRLLQKQKQQATTTNVHVREWQELLATSEEVDFAKTQFYRFKPDILIVNYVFLANILDAFPPNETALKVILTHDIFHKRFANFKKIGIFIDAGNWDWQAEAMLLRKAQVVLAIQKEDAYDLKQMAPESEVICLPKAAEVNNYHNVKQVPGRCFFVGNAVDHNYYGLKWFLEDVWLRVIELMPNSSLHVCGSVCDLIQGNYPNVRFLGRVNDLKPEYEAAEVCLVPLLAGSGLKIKLVEAMSYGRACVSSSVGVQGLGGAVGSAVLVADTPEDFAAAIHMVLTKTEKRQWMEEQAHKYAIAKLSPQAAYQPFVDYIHQYLYQFQKKMKQTRRLG
ncbi:glycosyltransferase [Pelatocladus sp. BLCC-F211]|uniref:glycosyltransferase n=1 Tax=Pelatocladus sp. BLCC-F211 TaxID=3342752 RepID=UPI0035B8055E